MLLVGPTNTQSDEGSGMDTSSGGPSRQPATHAGEPRRRRRWLFVVGGLVALGLVGLVVFAVVLILVATSGPTVPTLYDEEYVSGARPAQIRASSPWCSRSTPPAAGLRQATRCIRASWTSRRIRANPSWFPCKTLRPRAATTSRPRPTA